MTERTFWIFGAQKAAENLGGQQSNPLGVVTPLPPASEVLESSLTQPAVRPGVTRGSAVNPQPQGTSPVT